MRIHVADHRIWLENVRFEDNPRIKLLPNVRWHSEHKRWSVPATPAVALQIIHTLPTLPCVCEFGNDWSSLAHRASNLKYAVWAKDAPESDLPSYSFTPAVDPWTHQRRAFWFAHGLEASMLAMDMGTGKTKAAIDVARARYCPAILISCPSSVMKVWTSQLAQHDPERAVLLLDREWSVARRLAQTQLFLSVMRAQKRKAAVIINHEGLWREPFGSWVKGRERAFDHFIFDESHRGKQHNGRLGGYIKDLWMHVPSRMALTGMPFPHDQLDIFAQFRMLDPGVFGTSWTLFKEHYAVMGGFEGKRVVGVQNEAELLEKFNLLAYRVEADDVLDLPDEIETFRTFGLDDGLRKVYATLERDFYVEVEQGGILARNSLVKLLRLQQLTSGYCKVDPLTGEPFEVSLGNEKIDLFCDLLDNELPRPVVVFCRFKEDLKRISGVVHHRGLRYGEISGSRSDLTDDAKMPEWCDVLGVQIQAGGLGIDLTGSRCAVFYSVSYKLDDYEQCKRRLRRPGQLHNVLNVHLVAENSIDEEIYEALTKRRELIDVLLEKS